MLPLTYYDMLKYSTEKLVVGGQFLENGAVPGQVDQDGEDMLGYFLCIVSTRLYEARSIRNTRCARCMAYRVIQDENLEVFHGREPVGLEDGGLGCRIWDQIFERQFTDLGVWIGNEADELGSCQ